MTTPVWTIAEPDPLDRLPKFCRLPCCRDGRVMSDYGQVNGRGAHRWRWEEAFGPIPPGMKVLHHCDNPPCVELDHLYLGTDADNANDRHARGRTARGSAMPSSKLTEADIPAIRTALAKGESHQRIGHRYGVSSTTIRRIAIGRKWRHA